MEEEKRNYKRMINIPKQNSLTHKFTRKLQCNFYQHNNNYQPVDRIKQTTNFSLVYCRNNLFLFSYYMMCMTSNLQMLYVAYVELQFKSSFWCCCWEEDSFGNFFGVTWTIRWLLLNFCAIEDDFFLILVQLVVSNSAPKGDSFLSIKLKNSFRFLNSY